MRKEKNETWNVELKGLRAARYSSFPLWAVACSPSLPLPLSLFHMPPDHYLSQQSYATLHDCNVNCMWDIMITTVLLETKSWKLQSMSVTGMCLTQLLIKCFQNQIIKQYGNACLKRKAHARLFSQFPVLEGNKCVWVPLLTSGHGKLSVLSTFEHLVLAAWVAYCMISSHSCS